MVEAVIGIYSIDIAQDGTVIANIAKDSQTIRDNGSSGFRSRYTLRVRTPYCDEPSFLYVDSYKLTN